MTADNVKKFVAPLFGFNWAGVELDLGEGLSIKSLDSESILNQHEKSLSAVERDWCRQETRWLCLDWPVNSPLSPAATMNLFLLSLWIHTPTEVLLAYRFPTTPGEGMVRLLDRFAREDTACFQITDEDLKVVSSYIVLLKAIVITSPRAKSSLKLTLHGCMARAWQVAFMLLAVALESMLIYFGADEKKITERLARAYVALIDPPVQKREEIRKEFKRLYSIRSRIVHEAAYYRDNAQENLDDLAKLRKLLRSLWSAVCRQNEIKEYLLGENAFRQKLLQTRNGLLADKPDTLCYSGLIA